MTPIAGPRQGLSYGALGLPLAFVALPLYVLLPNHYADALGVPLALLGAVLLGARLFDALADPLIGRLVDRLFARSQRAVLVFAGLAAAALALGFHALFFPAVSGSRALLWWCALGLAVTYLGYSAVSVVHQSWGARLGGGPTVRARVVAWREALALAGVLVASVLPALAGLGGMTTAFALLLALGLVLLARAPRPAASIHAGGDAPGLLLPFGGAAFRRLLLVFLLNGVASAIPATLVLFFIRDRLQAPSWEPLFLAAYFAAGAASMPLWVRLVGRLGLGRSWLVGMLLAVTAFVWAVLLGAGDRLGFLAVCIASGIALGADLALPGALLTGVIQRAGHADRAEGAYFGWWNFATKLNLALAAGIALPLLAAIGYTPGAREPQALAALALAYGALPCVLKLLAALALWRLWLRRPDLTGDLPEPRDEP